MQNASMTPARVKVQLPKLWTRYALLLAIPLLMVVLPFAMEAQSTESIVRHTSGYAPMHDPKWEIGADRPAEAKDRLRRLAAPQSGSASNWSLLATLPSTYIHDISFATSTVGFVAAENGQVWKTADGGVTWTQVLGVGFPWEWYGIHEIGRAHV